VKCGDVEMEVTLEELEDPDVRKWMNDLMAVIGGRGQGEA
jgi:hypothetical protein